MADKKFFRIRLAEKSPLKSKIANGLTVTKEWQVKTGEIGDFAKFPDVEVQVMVKQGNGFVPAGEAVSGATKDPIEAPGNPPPLTGGDDKPDFHGMTVEQIKNYLIANGVAQNDLRNNSKQELIERAEFIWSQK